MLAAANNPKFAAKVKMDPKVAKDFVKADKGKKKSKKSKKGY